MSLDCAIVFAGPSLSGATLELQEDIIMRPPARRGDIYRVSLEEPRAILLIDGEFEDTPTVFHKEILWALSQGIHVFGAASLGALRAAELTEFGMVGYGKIYEDYQHERLERDDAVAVLHGPAELGWPTLTMALVDIEATLHKAESQGVVGSRDRTRLSEVAAECHWRERTFERVLGDGERQGIDSESLGRLRDWLGENHVSQKRSDALGLIAMVVESWDDFIEPLSPSFRFEPTSAWRALTEEVNWERQGISRDAYNVLEKRVRSQGKLQDLEMQALAMCLSERLFQEEGGLNEEAHLEQAAREFREKNFLTTAQDVAQWLSANRLQHSDYVDLVRHTGYLQQVRPSFRLGIATNIVRLLRSQGALPPDIADKRHLG